MAKQKQKQKNNNNVIFVREERWIHSCYKDHGWKCLEETKKR